MSYISSQLTEDRNSVIIWERDNNGVRNCFTVPAPYYFYLESNKGTYTSIYGNKLEKYDFMNYREFANTKYDFKNRKVKTYESDISAEHRVLSNLYYNKPINPLNVIFFDIEVDYKPEEGFATIENPYAPINAVSLFHNTTKKSLVFAVPPHNDYDKEKLEKLRDKANIILCKNEKQLLTYFLNEIDDGDILSGWNSDFFDIPYVYERLKRVLGQFYANMLSFKEAKVPEYREVVKFGVPQKVLEIYGRVSLDYLEVFKKFEATNRPSYSLEAIAESELPHLPKLEYEGTLHSLYNKDFPKFIEYNIRDTEILDGFEKKFGYIGVAIEMSHMNTAQINAVLGTVKMVEAAMINYCHHELDLKVPDLSHDIVESNEKYMGALVLVPQVGVHEWVSSVDIASLYPSTIRSINISPETLIGQFYDKYIAFEHIKNQSDKELTLLYENGDSETKSANEWRQYLKNNKWAVSGYGTVFTQEKQGIIPAILSSWFSDRKKFKKEAGELFKKLDSIDKNTPEYLATKTRAEYCDRVQYIKKIQLNSTYGAMGNPYFKFSDVRMAESTTRSGQNILVHMIDTIAEKLDGSAQKLQLVPGSDKDYYYPSPSIIYSDTDSVSSDSIVCLNDLYDTIENHFIHNSKKYDIFKNGNKEYLKISSDLNTICYDNITMQPIIAKVNTIYRHKVFKKKGFSIKLKNGKFIKVTDDHSLTILRNDNFVVIKPSELQKTDRFIEIIYLNKLLNNQIHDIDSIDSIEFDDEYVYDIIMEDETFPFFVANDILVHNSNYFKTKTNNKEDALQVGKLIQKLVNKSFPSFMQHAFLCNPDYDNLILAEQEIVSDKCIFTKKKMYALHVVYKDGKLVKPEDEMKVMGYQVKKTVIPKAIGKKLTSFLETFLKGKTWKELGQEIVDYRDLIKSSDDIKTIGLPKQISNIEEYTRRYKIKESGLRLPGHVAAAILWNTLLDEYQDKESMRISSGMKIKTFYLSKKIHGFKSIAIPTDLTILPEWFKENIEKFVDREAQAERLVDSPLKNILVAINEPLPTKKSLLIDEEFE